MFDLEQSAVQRSASAFRAPDKGDGQFMGSKEDLTNRLGISRPTSLQGGF